jgi:nitrogenase molybdenum-iron protein alpha/beta subunit
LKRSFPTVPTYLDGVMLATNACDDVFLLIDGVGCHSDKAERVYGTHDLSSDLRHCRGRHRVLTTEVGDADIVMGTRDKLRLALRKLLKLKAPRGIAVAPSVGVSLTHQFVQDILREFEAEKSIPVWAVSGPILGGDWLDGYSDFVSGLAEAHLRLSGPLKPRRRSRRGAAVAVVGHLMGRREQDELANIDELRRLLRGLGLKPAAVWLSGGLDRESLARGRVEGVVGLPSAAKAASSLGTALGVPLCPTALPVGFARTAGWLRDVARAFQKESAAQRFIDGELRRLIPRFEWVASRLAGRGVAVCADPFLAEGLVCFLREMGLRVPLVVVESRHSGQARPFEKMGIPEVLVDPDHLGLRDRLEALAGGGGLDLIIGNSFKRGLLRGRQIPLLELGFPSFFHHCFHPSPYLGFEGAACLLSRIYNLLSPL